MHINSSDCVQKCQRNDNFYITPRSRASAPIFTKQVRDQLPAYADNVALPAFARRCCSNRSISAANLQQRVCCCGPMRGQTDGRTPYRSTDPGPHTMRAMPVIKARQNHTRKKNHLPHQTEQSLSNITGGQMQTFLCKQIPDTIRQRNRCGNYTNHVTET